MMKDFILKAKLLKFFSILLLIVLFFTVFMSSNAQKEEKVFRLSIPGELDNLDPSTLCSVNHRPVQYGIFDQLVRSYKEEIFPGMAETWEISDDGMTYTFHLRVAKWSDGKPVTAGDFVYGFIRLFEVCPASNTFDDIKNGAELRAGQVPPEQLGVQAPDDKTVIITLKNPVPYFLPLLANKIASPSREDLVKKFGNEYGATVESLSCCGPFILKEWKHEENIVMVKNPDYWNAN